MSAAPTNSPSPYVGLRRLEQVERKLLALAVPSGPADGTVGSRTRQALCVWRDINRLPGGRRAVVTQAEADTIIGADALPAADRPDGLYVNKTCQILLQVRDGEYRRIVRVSTAAAGFSTPNGAGTVWRTWAGWHESSLYPDGWMLNSLYFHRDHPGIALHGSGSNDLVPPYPASHGCVRVWRPDINAIFREETVGTRVLVYGDYAQ